MRFFSNLLLIVLTLTVFSAEIGNKLTLTGSSEKPRYVSISKDRSQVIEPYSVDTANVLATLKEYKRLYYYGAWLHGAYLGFK